ncbi:hypothetical protein ADL35_17365, partial [Streptomyces sp. NRRL WC-3753]
AGARALADALPPLPARSEAAARRGSLGLVSEQCLYNLAERRAEMEVIPAAEEYGLGVIAWSPLHGGLLGGAIRKERGAAGRAPTTAGRATRWPTPRSARRSRRTRTCWRSTVWS